MSKNTSKPRIKPPQKHYSEESIGISNLSGYGNTEPKVVVAGQFQPVDRDYKSKGIPREEQFECRKDDVANAVLTGDTKNCVCIVAQRGRYNGDGKIEQRFEIGDTDTSNTLTTVQKDNLILLGYHKKNQQGNRVYDSEGISATITARGGCFGGNGGGIYKQTVVYDDYNSRVREDSDTMGTVTPNCGATAVRNGYKLIEKHVQNEDVETARTVRVGGRGSLDRHSWDMISDTQMRIRKLTPKECLRLMGWTDGQIALIQKAGVSNSQQYKQAGNGIVVQVLEVIFRQLFKGGAHDSE